MSHYTSNISFKCPKCTAEIATTIEVPETDWSGDTADDRFATDTGDVACENCAEDYALEIQNSDGTIFVSVVGHREVRVDTTYAEFVGLNDVYFDIPSDPDSIISQTLSDIRKILDNHGDEDWPSVVNRMVFIQQCAAMEAYLSDTLIGAVLDNPSALARLVKSASELKDVKLTLDEILTSPEIVKNSTATYLKKQLYHNLPKVAKLYDIAFGFNIFPSIQVKDRLNLAMPIRHDCVHRNGLDKDGNPRGEVVAAFVRRMDADLRSTVSHIEDMLLPPVSSKTIEW